MVQPPKEVDVYTEDRGSDLEQLYIGCKDDLLPCKAPWQEKFAAEI